MRDHAIGEAAYNKWRELVPNGKGFPLWSELPEAAKDGWGEIALAAVHKHLDEGMPDGS